MFNWNRKKEVNKFSDGAKIYVEKTYRPHIEKPQSRKKVQYSSKDSQENSSNTRNSSLSVEKRMSLDIQFSSRYVPQIDIEACKVYDKNVISKAMDIFNRDSDSELLSSILDKSTASTFVECVRYHIKKGNLKDSSVYKAAHIDRRLFSKIITDKNYKPSKDTAIAIAFALKLSTDEAIDLLDRAGFSLSHSNKRDVIIEYFFNEKEYNIMNVNDVLYRLGEKILGK